MSSGARCTRTVIAILRDIAASAAVSSPTSNAAPVRKERRCPSISCSQWPLCGGAQRRRGGPRFVGGDVAGEEFEARGEAHDEEKKLDEAALVATAAAAKRNLPPIWPPGSREGNVAKWDACRRVLDEAELAADLAEAGRPGRGGTFECHSTT